MTWLNSEELSKRKMVYIGIAGIVVTDESRKADRMRYKPDEQFWSPRVGHTSLVGTYRDAPPPPAELARDRQVDGEWVELLDGDARTVLILRAGRGGSTRVQVKFEASQELVVGVTNSIWLTS